MGLAIPVYNACLSVYYLLAVRYGVTDGQMKKWIEPLMHFVAFLLGADTALSGIPLNLFNADTLWCWIKAMPEGCTESWRASSIEEANCERGDNATLYRFVFYFTWVWSSIIVATIATVWLYLSVRRLENKSVKYRNPERRIKKRGGSTENTPPDEGGTNSDPATASAPIPEETTNRPRAQLLLRQASSYANSMRSTIREAAENRSCPRSRQVFQQAMCYIVAFFFTHFFGLVNQLLYFARGTTILGIFWIHLFFDPCQGFLNFIVYRRPRYTHIRKKNSNLTRMQCLYRALRWSFLGPIQVIPAVGNDATIQEQEQGSENDDSDYDSFHGCDEDYQKEMEGRQERSSALNSIEDGEANNRRRMSKRATHSGVMLSTTTQRASILDYTGGIPSEIFESSISSDDDSVNSCQSCEK